MTIEQPLDERCGHGAGLAAGLRARAQRGSRLFRRPKSETSPIRPARSSGFSLPKVPRPAFMTQSVIKSKLRPAKSRGILRSQNVLLIGFQPRAQRRNSSGFAECLASVAQRADALRMAQQMSLQGGNKCSVENFWRPAVPWRAWLCSPGMPWPNLPAVEKIIPWNRSASAGAATSSQRDLRFNAVGRSGFSGSPPAISSSASVITAGPR